MLKIQEKETQDTFLKATEIWGLEGQVRQFMEECAEGVVAANKYFFRGYPVQVIATEIADIEIMCSQMRQVIGDEVVDFEINEKLTRLKARLELAEYRMGKKNES